ncbi:ComF family protein [Dysgonomonadaceae bacterium PH5-43]|nr:ComF family protein [Dysgonomonadaceae bacterium PH5-43]
MRIKQLLQSFIYLFYPQLCLHCNTNLLESETVICAECCLKLPKTDYYLVEKNPAYLQLRSRTNIVKATSFLYYNKEGLGKKFITELKYKDNIAAGKWIARLMAEEIKTSSFFDDIDVLIPVPLHWRKKMQRGFNQSEIIAREVSKIAHIPVDVGSLYRKRYGKTQTKKGVYDRWAGTRNIFAIKDLAKLKGKHILIIDDVLTTGATLESCISVLQTCEGVTVSVLTVAVA